MLTSHPPLWNAVLHPQMHAHMPHFCTLVCAHVDDLVVGCQCQRQVENPTSLTLALLSQWTKRDLRNLDASYCFFCNFSKCWPSLIYQWFGLGLMGVFLVFLAVLWPRWGAVCLRQPRRIWANGSATVGLRVVLLCCFGLSETLSREAAFLCSLLHHIHTMVRWTCAPFFWYMGR